jgi:hypothetical protein
VDLSASHLHRKLDLIAVQGWDGPVGTELLSDLRQHVVRPVVRATRLRGPAADQAEATAWAAAWDAIRRPTARTAENPGGMVWGAVRRSVAVELRQGDLVGLLVGDSSDLAQGAASSRSSSPVEPDAEPSPSLRLGLVIALLVEVGWEPCVIAEVVDHLADGKSRRVFAGPSAGCDVPAWQRRRVARLVRSGDSTPSLLELVQRYGRMAVEHPAAAWAARSTLSRWQAGPAAALEQLAAALVESGGLSAGSAGSRRRPRHVGWTRSESAETMGSLP